MFFLSSSQLLPLILISSFLKKYIWELDLSEKNVNNLQAEKKTLFFLFNAFQPGPVEVFLLWLLDKIQGRFQKSYNNYREKKFKDL